MRQKTSSELLLDELIRTAKSAKTAKDHERFQVLAAEYETQAHQEWLDWQHQHQAEMLRLKNRNLDQIVPMCQQEQQTI